APLRLSAAGRRRRRANTSAMKRRYAVALFTLAFAGCASGTPVPQIQSPMVLQSLSRAGSGKITHVVYVIQENRSFDNLFQGYPGADTVAQGMNSHGQTIPLQPVSLSTR